MIRKLTSSRTIVWSVVSTVVLLLGCIGVFVGFNIDSAVETATQIARPHEVQTQLEKTKATLDALQDAVQDFIVDGADSMRYQYEDSARTLGAQMSELAAMGGIGLPPAELDEIDNQMASVLQTSRAV